MKKIYFIITIVFLIIIIFFNFFSITKTETALSGNKISLVRKVQNPNRLINILLPKPEKVINIGDIIVHKDVVYADKTFRQLRNKTNRVFGLPGDRVRIYNKNVYNNDSIISIGTDKVFFKYRISFEEACDCEEILRGFKLKYIETLADGLICEIVANPKTAKEIAKQQNISNIRLDKLIRNTHSRGFFPENMFFSWNKDYFGPVIVPEKNVTVKINPRNVALYSKIIDRFENNLLIYNLAGITINNEKTEQYTFQNNYYFVLNDNRDIKKDSRYYGFIPEDYITGKVIL